MFDPIDWLFRSDTAIGYAGRGGLPAGVWVFLFFPCMILSLALAPFQLLWIVGARSIRWIRQPRQKGRMG